MNARIFLELAQRDDLEARHILADLPGLSTSNPNELATLIANYFASLGKRLESLDIDRTELKKASVRFHEKAGTLTESVQRNIELIMADVPIIRIAHTPDHFGYLGVYTLFIFQNLTARALFTRTQVLPCQIYLDVDTDIVEDKRLRSSHFPDIEREHGSLNLSVPIPPHSIVKVIRAVDKPSTEIVNKWISSLRRLVAHNLKVLYRGGILQKQRGKLRGWLDEIEQEMWEAYNRSSNLAEFNTIFVSRIVNLHWNLSTAFVPSSEVAPLMKRCYEYLLPKYPAMVDLSHQVVELLQSKGLSIKDNLKLSFDDFPLWYICQNCSARVRLRIVSKSRLIVSGVCPGCTSKYQADFGTFSIPTLDPMYDKLAPKVLFDELADIVGWRITGGVSYIGSAEHILTNSLIAFKLGLPVPPECLWRPRGIYYGLVEARTAQSLGQIGDRGLSDKSHDALQRVFLGRGSILYYLLSQGFEGLYKMWEEHFEIGKQTYDVNRGQSPFVIPHSKISLLEGEINQIDQLTLLRT